MLPSVIDSYFATALYGALLVVIYLAIQSFRFSTLRMQYSKAIVWVGAISVVLSLIGFAHFYQEAMFSIQEVGDISPALVAGAIGDAAAYPKLGLINLGVAFLVRFVLSLNEKS